MRVSSTKNLRFHHPDDRATFVDVVAGVPKDVDDWVRQSDMFKAASHGGTVSAYETPVTIAAAPAPEADASAKAKAPKAPAAD